MIIKEFADTTPANDSKKLLALSTFLKDRAEDENARAEISQDAFIQAAQSLGINVTKENLNRMINQAPLNNVFEPIESGTDVVRFRGNVSNAGGMSVDQARAVVDSNAKAAMKRRQ